MTALRAVNFDPSHPPDAGWLSAFASLPDAASLGPTPRLSYHNPTRPAGRTSFVRVALTGPPDTVGTPHGRRFVRHSLLNWRYGQMCP